MLMSICCGPKVHQSSRWLPSCSVTSSLGCSALRVRISSRSFSVGRSAPSWAAHDPSPQHTTLFPARIGMMLLSLTRSFHSEPLQMA
jgi:hypothetical protein